ncbi:MAG TPA: group I intron-associated PD-(D/E)XK endonuclease [Candidatus Limnocylindria bacterium]|nr:group I intron-associated PD-(D/E)XK endonuclease [Candidatus Limnocylindria bacterium]
MALALTRAGRKLLRPLSSATRYDLLIDNEDGSYTRVQCKTGRFRDGCIRFNAFSISGHNTTTKRYQGEVDAFGVYCPQIGETYLVPIAALSAAGTVGWLRVSAARNGQHRGIRLADRYRLEARNQAEPLGAHHD